jgi:hypothetical protein
MKTLLIMIGLAGLAGCTTKVRTVADFDRLPRSEGFNTGSFWVEPWEYGASDVKWHQFYYSWFKWNWTHTRQVKIQRDLVSLPFERPLGGYYKTVRMEPVMRNGQIVGFREKSKHQNKTPVRR